jgi:molybdopterin-guanine dinucleotide biosynthesis protein B
MTAPVIGIAGWKKSGKTTLAVRLIEAFTRRGLKVGSIKHAHHGFRVDEGNTDSARHRQAGAQQVAIVSRLRWALIRELASEAEPDLEDVIHWLDPCDIVVVEGYKTAPIAKIEVRRTAAVSKDPICAGDPHVIAIAADHAVAEAGRLPVFALDDIEAIADFISRRLELRTSPTGSAGGHAAS